MRASISRVCVSISRVCVKGNIGGRAWQGTCAGRKEVEEGLVVHGLEDGGTQCICATIFTIAIKYVHFICCTK